MIIFSICNVAVVAYCCRIVLWQVYKCSDIEVILCSFGNCVYICRILLLEYSMYFRVKFVISINQLPLWINKLYYEIFFIECVSLKISYNLHFFRISKVSSMLHHRPLEIVHSKECYFIFTYIYLAFVCCFSSRKLCFYHIHFFFW